MSRQAEARERTKTKIMKVARELFIAKGYSETTLQDILTAGDISKGNLYHHFKGKEFLFLHIVEEDCHQWKEKWEERKSFSKNAIERLYDLATFSVEESFNYYPIIQATEEFFASAFKSQEVIERLNEIEKQYLEIIEEILLEGNHDKSWNIKDIDSSTQIVSSLFLGLEAMVQHKSYKEKEKIHQEAVRLLIKGLQ
ncbi:TetR/AcrR family transcriptional regulator [Priestia filamentosa]|uniref:TetR/AcrR family transcriptional regulator n=1 Tax=Priestia filamentosa TaxID=1402861 RepID=UPI000E7353CF|nr:TetR family transcriptional regulator C-terminal domain-containing protein [Priestia filamentosa]RJS63122.1 TetR family transcriptional regulator [Priestia filamentosa]